MIKKAVLPLLAAPFLMVFSVFSFAGIWYAHNFKGGGPTPAAACMSYISKIDNSNASDAFGGVSADGPGKFICTGTRTHLTSSREPESKVYGSVSVRQCSSGSHCAIDQNYIDAILANPLTLPPMSDEECSENGDTISVSASSANYLNNGGSVKTHAGACSISGAGGVTACTGTDGNITCTLDIVSESTGEFGEFTKDSSLNGAWGEGSGTFSVVDFNTPEYLEPLPGGCSDPSSCVTIGDTSYLVDWDSAPDYFSYVDSNGTTHSKPSSGGGSGGDTGGGDNGGGNPTDPGGDNGSGDSGGDAGGGDDSGNDDSDDNDGSGGSGGGSTVPDFEFDESGIIEAIGSAGRSNRNAINALSNDVTGAISDQTNDLNNATSAQTDSLNSTLNNQTDSLTNSLDGQTDDLTSALEDQTGTITNSLDALGTTFTDALKGLGLGSGDDDSGDGDGDGDGEGEDGEGDGLLGGISKLLNKMVDKLASRFTEDLGNGDDLFNSTGMDETLDGAALQEQEHGDEINSLMDEIGDGASSDIAEQITSRLPSLPSGGCVPLQFGPMEISCQSFNTIKLWLTWIIYFWTVVSIVDTFFRSEQRTA
jgi:hypothetical protein